MLFSTDQRFWFMLKVWHGLDLAGIMLIALKLAGATELAWLWITAPFWGSILIAIPYILYENYRRAKRRAAYKSTWNPMQ